MIKQILFDFDGVIIDSMNIRDKGFRIIAEEVADKETVEKFLIYHRYNAGLSRFVKIKYLYENMLGQHITDEKVNLLASQFSLLMKKELVTKEILIQDTLTFIKKIHQNITLHIVSGSEENELNFLCEKLNLKQYFKTIEGSPTPKNHLVKNILQTYNYDRNKTILIGDSISDYNAANINNISFYGYNNKNLIAKSSNYIHSFAEFNISKGN